MSDHECDVCLIPFTRHSEKCDVPGHEEVRHWPPTCCPGCGCESYEEAHPAR